MDAPDFVNVRRPIDDPFRVLSEDLVAEEPPGYDLDLMRSLTKEGLVTPIVVRPLADGRFLVLDGEKRIAAVRMLMRINTRVYDLALGLMRPARQAFAFLCCRVRPGILSSSVPDGGSESAAAKLEFDRVLSAWGPSAVPESNAVSAEV